MGSGAGSGERFPPQELGGGCDLLHPAENEAIVFHKSTANAHGGENRSIEISRLFGTKSSFLMLPIFNFIYRYSMSGGKKPCMRLSTSQASRLPAMKLRPCRDPFRKCKPVNYLQPLVKQRDGLELWHRKRHGRNLAWSFSEGPEVASKQVKSEVTKVAKERKAAKQAYEAQEG